MDPLTLLAAALVLIGAGSALFMRRAFDKLIMLGILTAGAVLFFVISGYLDVAIVVALIMPVGTLFILFLLGKKTKPEEEK